MTLSLDRQNTYRQRYSQIKPGWRPATEVYESIIRERLHPGMRVIDLGCGRGGVLEQLGAAVTYPIGFDPDLQSLREHRLHQLPRAESLADSIPLRANTADMILCSWVMEHLTHPEHVFREISRVLHPGGYAIFLTPNATSLIVLLNRIMRPLQHKLVPLLYGRAEEDTFPVVYRANTKNQIDQLARESGLQIEQIHLIEDPTYLAFNNLFFKISILTARLTPPVHLIGVLKKI